MKQSLLIITFIIIFKTTFAQQASPIVKVSFKGKKDPFAELRISGFSSWIKQPSIYIEGYDGDNLTIEPYNIIPSKTIQADTIGLRNVTSSIKVLYPAPSEDAPEVKELPDRVQISIPTARIPGANAYKALLIKVPRNIHLKLLAGFILSDAGIISLKDLTGELEISGYASLIEINNISGPLSLSSSITTSSKIKISHIKWIKPPVDKEKTLLYISSQSSDIDISLPGDLKATFNISSTNGEIYSDLNLVRRHPASNVLNNFSGDLNGGGIPITIITNYGNVFLRKEK